VTFIHVSTPFLMQRSTAAAAVNRQTVQKYILAGSQFFWTVQNETVIRPEEFSSPFPRPSRIYIYVCVCGVSSSSRPPPVTAPAAVRLLPLRRTAKSAYRKRTEISRLQTIIDKKKKPESMLETGTIPRRK